MKYIKNLLTWLLWIWIVFSLSFSYTHWLWTGNTNIVNPKDDEYNPLFSWEIIDGDPSTISKWWKSFAEKLRWIIEIPSPSNYETSLWYVLKLIQVSINWALWMLSLIALIYMLYCGFLVFSSWTEDKNAQKGKKWITTAATALAWIWLSWLIVSAMIWFITNVSKAN